MKWLVFVLMVFISSLASAQILSTFDSDADGWTTSSDAVGFPVPVYVSTGGNDGGFIRATDNAQGSYFYFVAPAKFTGDLSGNIGDTLFFDMYFNVTGESAPSQSDVTITGGGLTLVTDLFTAGPADTWLRRAVPLNFNGGWRKTSVTGSVPTESEFLSAMSSVTGLRIKGEYTTAVDITGLDNVLIGSILSLPVELSSFSASALSEGVLLTWSTKTERNNYGFEIERRSQALRQAQGPGVRSQKNSWETIGFVSGKGTTNDPQAYSFTDSNVSGKATYRLKQVDFDGAFEYSNEVEFIGTPGKFEVVGNYPNPFNPSTVIRYQLSEISDVSISVYNVIGQQVATLVNSKQPAGVYDVPFNATGQASGLYIYKVQAGANTVTRTMMLTK